MSRVGAALVIIWTIELFAVQELTLTPMHHQNLRQFLTYRTVRLALDATLVAALVIGLPRKALVALFALNPVFYVGVIVYHDYFKQPLSALVLLNQGAEGLKVTDAFLPLIEWWHIAFIAVLVAKIALGWRLHPRTSFLQRRQPALVALGAYAVVFVVMNALLQPLHKIGTWDSVGGLGSIYGYLPTWSSELLFIDDDSIRARAIERAERGPGYDVSRLSKIEPDLPIGDRIVFLQIESFDQSLIDFEISGKPVTPEMNRLWRESLRYVVRAPKGRGSSDADFKALMGKLPAADVPTFKIQGYPYGGSVVERLRAHGFHTTAIHGVTGEFFNRRPAYEQMGFDALEFREEFSALNLAPVEGWAVKDHLVLEHATRRLNERGGKQFQIVITATSHIPYPLEGDRKVFFPERTEAVFAYFDSVHYVDAAIGRFVHGMPDGTTLVAYGDHVSQVENAEVGYEQVRHDSVGCVPFIVHVVGENLSSLSRADKLATSCELTMLEAFRFVHDRIDRRHGGHAPSASGP